MVADAEVQSITHGGLINIVNRFQKIFTTMKIEELEKDVDNLTQTFQVQQLLVFSDGKVDSVQLLLRSSLFLELAWSNVEIYSVGFT